MTRSLAGVRQRRRGRALILAVPLCGLLLGGDAAAQSRSRSQELRRSGNQLERIGIGVSVLGAVVAAVGAVLVFSKQDMPSAQPRGSVVDPTAPATPRTDRRPYQAGLGLLGVGLGGVATGITLYGIGWSRLRKAQALELTPGPSLFGTTLRWRF